MIGSGWFNPERRWARLSALALLLLSLWSAASQAAWPSGGGSGTAPDPYILLTPADLAGIGPTGATMSASYKLGADIDLAGYDPGDGGGWMPIGFDANAFNNNLNIFSGTFDGNGYAIWNLTVNRPASNNIALFYHASGQLINVRLLNVNITGNSFVGAVAGVTNGLVQDCYVTGAVNGGSVGGVPVGGLVGASNGTIRGSWSAASVSGVVGVGGLVGRQWGVGIIEDSYVTGSVTSAATWGGADVGGLVGDLEGTGVIQNVYASGGVSAATPTDVGGLVGSTASFTAPPGVVNSAYWDTETTGQPASAAGVGRTTAQMQTRANYPGFDFATTWGIVEGRTYPYLLATEVFVTYDGNGSTAGSVPADNALHLVGDTATALDAGTVARTGYTFAGWNTRADGSGKPYAVGDSFAMGNDVTLYAQWTPSQTTHFSGGGALTFPWIGLLLLLAARRRQRNESLAA